MKWTYTHGHFWTLKGTLTLYTDIVSHVYILYHEYPDNTYILHFQACVWLGMINLRYSKCYTSHIVFSCLGSVSGKHAVSTVWKGEREIWALNPNLLPSPRAPGTWGKPVCLFSSLWQIRTMGIKSSFHGQDFLSRPQLTHFWQYAESETCLLPASFLLKLMNSAILF